MTDIEPNPQPGAQPKRITIKQPSWSWDKPFDVLLVARRHYVAGYEGRDHDVYLPNEDGTLGAWLGVVGKYSGSIDTKIAGTRLRHEGVRRTLWTKQAPQWDRSDYGNVSRAECIRSLKDHYERMQKKGKK